MRLVLLILILAPHLFQAQGKARVKVHVTYTNSYCGGARPTPEIEQKYQEPKNFRDVHLVLDGKVHCKTKTDTAGYFSLPLKPGKYTIHLTRLKNEAHYTNYDPSCKKMLKASYGELIVSKGILDYELNLHFPCNPCEPPRQ